MTEEQKALYDYLTEHVTDDETAKIIIDGGEQGFYYGSGGYVVIADYETAEAFKDDNKFVVTDDSLADDYLIGHIV